MYNPNKDDGVQVAFDLILEEIGSASHELKSEVKNLVDLGRYDEVSKLSETGKALENFLLKVVRLKTEWTRDFDETTRKRTIFLPVINEPKPKTNLLLHMDYGNAHAEAEYSPLGIIVLAGSTIRKESHLSLGDSVRKTKDEALKKGQINAIEGRDVLSVEEAISFNSPSAAACFVAGCSVSGPREWRVTEEKISLKNWLNNRGGQLS